MTHKLESRLQGEISTTSDMQMLPSLWQKVKRNERGSWWRCKRSEKAGLKFSIQKTKIMASGSITSWHKDGNTMETVFLSSKIAAGGDCSHEIKRYLLLGRKAVTNLDNVLKSRDITLPTKVCMVKAMVFPVVMYGWENWTIKKSVCQRINAFKLWCWRKLLRVPLTARRSKQSILKAINPEYSLKGLVLKPKLQYFGHLMPKYQKTGSLEKTLMLGKTEGRRRRGQQKMASLTRRTWFWASSRRWWWAGKHGMLQSMGSQRVRHDWVTELNSKRAVR